MEKQINIALEKYKIIFEKAAEIIDNMAIGERIAGTKLANSLEDKCNMTGASLYAIIQPLALAYESTGIIKIQRGRSGGYIKVAKNEKEEKEQEEQKEKT